ncbi:hypothetical protein GCM10009730_53890 [Streptomyces albidochromogenes]
MVHTVRRALRGVEQGRVRRLRTARAAHVSRPGVTTEATPGQLRITTTRIPRSVPEHTPDSGP